MHPLDIRYKSIVHYKYFDSSLRRVAKTYNISKFRMKIPLESKATSSKASDHCYP